LITSWSTLGPARADDVDFLRDVQPIFAARCWSCHGASDAVAGLRLIDRESALAPADSGEPPIVPSDPQSSELIRRVLSEDDSSRMPPDGPPLSTDQVETLRQWIATGADWPPHWAYAELHRPAVPTSGSGWARNPIDHFVATERESRGLPPAPETDRVTWLRRVHFDLLGLPPSPERIAEFLADDSPHAHDRILDRLLADPAYGERQARHWIDLIHFAETHGHDQDRPRDHAWPYRDYLINAFNDDIPYGEFIREQIAGDVLGHGDPRGIVATGLLAAGPWDESSLRDIREDTDDREIARYLDRDNIVTTVMSTFVSSTVHCARCHDHKFDPISQADHYNLQAVFAATDKANRLYDAGPDVARHRRELNESLADLPNRLAAADPSLDSPEMLQAVETWEKEIRDAESLWRTSAITRSESAHGSTLTPLPDGSVLAGGDRPERDTYSIWLTPADEEVRGVRLELLTDDSLPLRGPGRQDNGNLHLNRFRIFAVGSGDEPDRELQIASAVADFDQAGWGVQRAIDGQDATAWGIYPQVGVPHEAVFTLAEPWSDPNVPPVENSGDDDSDSAVAHRQLRVELQQSHGGGHLIGRFRLSTTASTPRLPSRSLDPELVELLGIVPAMRTADDRRRLAVAYAQQDYRARLDALPPQSLVYCGTNRFAADGSFRPSTTPRSVRLLGRGELSQPLGEATPGALECLENFPGQLAIEDSDDEGQRRAALANWLADPRNPLTWRSIANRIWQWHFGRGLVDTPNDFGRMGAAPTHPELLDWLASQLRDGDHSIKSLRRLILTSATYRQASTSNPDAAAIDAENRLLWRFNRQRLDAESFQDSVLAVAGTLDRQLGGPSVKQFIQTPGTHVTPNVDYRNFPPDAPALRRRSVYRFLFRTIPDPFMDALDCPDGSQLTPVRNESITAMQALATLNDKSVLWQCRQLAAAIERDIQADPDGTVRAQATFRRILGRDPTDEESTAVAQYIIAHGLPAACRVLFNSNEFLFVD